MKKDELIEKAMKALENAVIVKDNKADKAYNGAIASFGASLTQSGLLATLAIYCHDSGDASRPKILQALYYILEGTEGTAKNLKDFTYKGEELALKEDKLFKYALSLSRNEQVLLELQIAKAAIALKLVLRTYKLS